MIKKEFGYSENDDDHHSVQNWLHLHKTFTSRKKRNYLIFGLLALVVILALAIGLGVGLSHSSSSTETEQDNALALQNQNNTNTSCLSDCTSSSSGKYQPVLLISLDGFHASYLTYNVTPNIERLIKEGVHTPWMLPVYPSLTFPNHYTIITGLYPESHGLVENSMYDTTLKKSYRIGAPETSNPQWYGGEPMWLTVQKYGRKSASYFWVGSDVAIEGTYPNYYKKYNSSISFSSRVEAVIEWLSLPAAERPDFITLYFDEPDSTGHKYGPEPGPEMLGALKRIDEVIYQLISSLENRNLYNSVNLILVSDHGMASRSCSRVVFLSEYLSADEMSKITVYTSASGSISNRYSGSRNIHSYNPPIVPVETLINKLNGQNPHFAVYEKTQLPKRLHYANNIRIGEVIVKMEVEWSLARLNSSNSVCGGGTHGWDNQYESMAALFIARGPAFKQEMIIQPFENIELYNLLADVMNITAAPNNGTRGALHHILKSPPTLKKLENNVTCQQGVHPDTDLKSDCNCSQSQTSPHPFKPPVNFILQPLLTQDAAKTCYTFEDHTTAYSSVIHMPLWTAFTVGGAEDVLPDNISCIVPDVALPVDEQTVYRKYINTSADLTSVSFFTTVGSCGTVTYASALVPVMTSLKNGLWASVWRFVRAAVNHTGPLSVIVGPIFDYDSNGLLDDIHNLSRFVDSNKTIPLPSHYFVILAHCAPLNLSACGDSISLLSFILPQDQPSNRQSEEQRLLENVARVRDIELLTGLLFFQSMDPAASAQLRTHVPTRLWTTSS